MILPRLLGWDIHQNDDYFLTFLVATHLATAIVLIGFFFATGGGSSPGCCARCATARSRPTTRTPAWAGCSSSGRSRRASSGSLLEHPLRSLFASASSAAAFLIVNGLLLLGFERLRARAPVSGEDVARSDERIARLSWRQAIAVGTSQATALIPGISRSGVTMGGGLLVGLSNEDAARYAFLLATPIIGAAAVLKLPDLFGHKGDGVRGPALVAALCAAVATYLAVRFLLRYFETNRLTPFGIYCIAAGLACTVVFALGG